MARKHHCYGDKLKKQLPFWRCTGSNANVLDSEIEHRYEIALWSQLCRIVYENTKHLYLSF